jgi:hypothetical protein
MSSELHPRLSNRCSFMHSPDSVDEVQRLIAAGLNDCEIARITGIPRRTVLDWRHGRPPRRSASTGCDTCHGIPPSPPQSEYAYLLGLYLGDGCISRSPRSYRIRFALDAAYPGIIDRCAEALETIRPGKHAWRGPRRDSRCVEVSMYWNHWPCLIPQHGDGPKHLRRIALVPWQQAIVESEPRWFVRGLIESDGCRILANDRGIKSVRYHFSNRSEDIKKLYCESLDAPGITWTRPCAKQVAVYRRSAVALLDEFIGPKR